MPIVPVLYCSSRADYQIMIFRRQIWGWAVFVLVVVVLAVTAFLRRRGDSAEAAEVAELIARELGIKDVQGFHLNYPAHPGRYPGTIMDADSDQPEKSVDTTVVRFNCERSGPVSLNLTDELGDSTKIRIPFLTGSLSRYRQVDVILEFDSLWVLELDVGQLAPFASPYLPAPEAKDTSRIIRRAFEGNARFIIRRTRATDGAGWVRVRDRVQRDVEKQKGAGLRITKSHRDSIYIAGPRQVLAFQSENICVRFCDRPKTAETSPKGCAPLHLHQPGVSVPPKTPAAGPTVRPGTAPARVPGQPASPATSVAPSGVSGRSPHTVPPPLRMDTVEFVLDGAATLIAATVDDSAIIHFNSIRVQEALYLDFYIPHRPGFRRVNVRYKDRTGAERTCSQRSYDPSDSRRTFNC
jgi:hypothetical protein